MKFRFYITNLFDGCIQGTDNEEVARNMSMCEDFFVVDTSTGCMLVEGNSIEVEKFKSYNDTDS